MVGGWGGTRPTGKNGWQRCWGGTPDDDRIFEGVCVCWKAKKSRRERCVEKEACAGICVYVGN